jgi:hypothetical protein
MDRKTIARELVRTAKSIVGADEPLMSFMTFDETQFIRKLYQKLREYNRNIKAVQESPTALKMVEMYGAPAREYGIVVSVRVNLGRGMVIMDVHVNNWDKTITRNTSNSFDIKNEAVEDVAMWLINTIDQVIDEDDQDAVRTPWEAAL